MKPTGPKHSALARAFHLMIKAPLLPVLVFALTNQSTFASSATWSLNPTNGLWSTAANWTPPTVPNAPSDTATFDVSNITSVSSGTREINGITFNSGASAFTITYTSLALFTMSGTGVVNDSGILQKFVVSPSPAESGNTILTFSNSATAGSNTEYTAVGASTVLTYGGRISFLDDSSAGSGTFIVEGGRVHDSSSPGELLFGDSATAGDATIINNGGLSGGFVAFAFNLTTSAGNALFITNGGMASGEVGGFTVISWGGTATVITNGGSASGAGGAATLVTKSGENATFVINGGTNGGDGGTVSFSSESTAEDARFEIFGNGLLDISQTTLPPPAIGSIEGDGLILVGTGGLTVGNNNLSTTFGGNIQELEGVRGSVTKVGTGKLTLSGANTYSGGTTVNEGILLANNTSGSATGKGLVEVISGTLGGDGTIAGAVAVGTGTGSGAFLGPGENSVTPGTLTIRKNLKLLADATYRVTMNSSTPAVDKVNAKGVRIRGALILFNDGAGSVLPPGTVFTVIDNRATTPISGTFSNLADGATVTVGSNTFQADYQGGDGNDLTLTVVP